MSTNKTPFKLKNMNPGIFILSLYMIWIVAMIAQLFFGFKSCGVTETDRTAAIQLIASQIPLLAITLLIVKTKRRVNGWWLLLITITVCISLFGANYGNYMLSPGLFGCGGIGG